MNKLKSNLDMADLVSRALGMNYKVDDTTVEMAYLASGGIPKSCIFDDALKEIDELLEMRPIHIMLNKMHPGTIVPRHLDPVAQDEKDSPIFRWHLPLITNPDCYWRDEESDWISVHMEAGYWYGPMPFRKLHQVVNLGSCDRIHLIVDLKRRD